MSKFAGTDFTRLVWYLAGECPTDSAQAVLFIISVTQADAVTHTKSFSNDSPEVCGARSAAQPTQRSFPAGPGRQLQCWKSLELGLGQGKVSGQGRKGHPPIFMAAGSATSCKAELWALHMQRPDLYPAILIRTLPGCHITSKHVILQYTILLLNQDNASINNNIIITCSTVNKFCRVPEHHISVTDSNISSSLFFI